MHSHLFWSVRAHDLIALVARPAEQVAPELIGCLLVKRQEGGELLRAITVSTLIIQSVCDCGDC